MVKKILIIDDEENFCQLVKLNLELTENFEVLISTTGKQGVELAKSERPDLILLDLIIPDIDGSETAERLLNDSATKYIPIIFLTAIVGEKQVKDSKGTIGGREFISKPVKPEELIRRIEEALEK